MTTRLSTGLQNSLAGVNTELVTNGNFTSDAASWTAVTATLTYTAGPIDARSNVLNVNGSAGYGHQAIATKVGHLYKLVYLHDASSGNGYVRVGTAAGGTQNYNSGNLSTTGSWTTVTTYFLATATTSYISLGTDGTGNHYYDGISLISLARSVQDVFNGGNIKIYTGTQPADADDVATGTLLVTINNGGSGLTFGDAADGVLSKTVGETWSGVCANTGTAGWFRLMQAGDLGTDNTTDCRIDGTVATSGGEINFTSLAFVVGATQTISDYHPTVQASV